MGFSLGSFMAGAADAGTASIKSAKIKREEERAKVEDMIFRTSARLFENGKTAEDLRTSEIKANKQYMTKLLSMAPSLRGDQARQAFILGLDEEGRKDIITMVNSDAFVQDKETKGLADYMDASDDPVEFKDPVTLGERVQGVVTDRPMDKSAYYGVSTTKDKEVDKIVDSYTSSFSVAYGMSAARAQGLLDAAKQEVRVQGFTIDWAHKKLRGAQEDARVAALVATATLGTETAKQNIVNSLTKKGSDKLAATRILYIQSSGIHPTAFQEDKNNQAKYLQSNAYKTATKEIIESAVMRMEEHPTLRETTEMFLNESFPGKWGGRVGGKNTVESLKPDVYYIGNFGNGSAVATGAAIQAAKAAQGKQGVSAGDITAAEKDSTYKKGSESKKVTTANIAQQDTNIANMRELGESESTIQKEQDYKDKLVKAESAVEFFNNLDEAPSASDASKMADAVTEIVSEGKAEAIQGAIDKILSMKSGLGQSPIVSAAVSNALNTLAAAQEDQPNVTEDSMAKLKLDLSSDTEWTELRIKNAIKEVNAYPEWAIKTDKVRDLKATLYAKLEAL